ncbi:hypothetical protein KQI52_04675 [bacterium]|nr:hypothetical protein [bacterium]
MASSNTRFLLLLLATLLALGAVCSAEPSLPSKTAVVGSIKNPDTGKGVAGATVWYDPIDLDDRVEQDRFYNFADGKGVFLAYLYPGRWRIVCEVPGFLPVEEEIRVRAEGHDPCDYVLKPRPRGQYTENRPSLGYAHIHGRVRDNYFDVGLPNVTVTSELGRDTTDGDGRFAFYDISLREQQLTFSHPAYLPDTVTIHEPKEGQVVRKEFYLRPDLSPEDTLSEDPNDYSFVRGTVIEELSRQPVDAYVAMLAPRERAGGGLLGRFDGGSEFEFERVPVGKRMIYVNPVLDLVPDTVMMISAQPADTLTLEIPLCVNSGMHIPTHPKPPGVIAGVARSWYSGEPLIWHTVRLQGLYHWAETDSSGYFQLDHVPVGDHVLHLSERRAVEQMFPQSMFRSFRGDFHVVHGIHVFSGDTTWVDLRF